MLVMLTLGLLALAMLRETAPVKVGAPQLTT
jgi:hypothetical protein